MWTDASGMQREVILLIY
ncbi:Protein of unknown function [Bacillus mycoides]|nr:Protein of unknown function [Bacillus mycoides]